MINPTPPPKALDLEADDLRIAREIIAQAWCTKENAHKVMDGDLAEAGAKLFANWIGTARQHLRNEEYYRGLLDQCAQALGDAVYIQDDGGKSDSVLRAKVPELVARLREESTRAPSAKCPGAYRLHDDLVVCRLCGKGEEAHVQPLPDAPGARCQTCGLAENADRNPTPWAYQQLSQALEECRRKLDATPKAPGHLEARGRECWVLFRQMDAYNNIPVEVRHYNPGNDFLEGDRWIRMVEAPTEEAGTPAPLEGA